MRAPSQSVFVVGVGLLLAYAVPASADLTGLTFEGTIDVTLGRFSAPFASIASGDSYTFTYMFESATADSDPSRALGAYFGAIQGFEVSIGATSVMGTPTSDFIAVDDESSPGIESYEASVATDAFVFTVEMDLQAGTLSSDALPTAFAPGAISAFQFTLFDPLTEGSALGKLTSFSTHVVPVPSAALLGVFGFGIVVWLRQRDLL